MGWSTLYPYQREAVDTLEVGNILCGGVGSGKSMTAIAWYYQRNGGDLDADNFVPMDDIDGKPLYIITTARKRDTREWEKDMAPFLMSTNITNNIYTFDVTVDSWNNITKYKDVTNAVFIFDEQRVVGSGTWVKTFLQITKNNDWILLSATPGDTWTDYIPVFIANGFYKNRSQFNREHIIFKAWTKFPQVDRYINTGRLIRLRDKILVDMDFKRNTVAHHERIFCEFDKAEYRRLMKERCDKDGVPFNSAGMLCYELRKVVNSDISRQQTLLNIFSLHKKVIIFYNHDYELEILRHLDYGTADVAEWNGHAHQEVPDSNSWVYLVQYTAGAEGWNCIKTDTIIFYSQTYSYKQLKQACGRIDRLNTPFHDLYYYHFLSKSPIDLGIDRCLKNKRNFNEGKFINS